MGRCVPQLERGGFKAKMRINRATFNFIRDGICEDIILTPTKLKPNPTSPD